MIGTPCGAKNRAGNPCQCPAMANGRCRLHGGTRKSGLGHPNLTHGRYSKHLPTRLAASYREAMADPELISVRDELALVDARLADVISRVDSGEAGRLWSALRDAVAEESWLSVSALVSEGVADYAAWHEVFELIERRRKLAETETKRLSAMGQQITAERAMVLLGAVVSIIQAHVTDRTILASISSDIGKLVDQGPRREA